MAVLRWSLAMLLLLAVGLPAIGHHNARADPIVRTAAFAMPGWPRGAKPVRLALIADIHLGNETMDVPRLRRIVRQVDALAPDVIVIAGDFVAGHDRAVARAAAADMVAPLAELRAPLGVVAVLGNHDYTTEPALIAQALRRAHVRVLANAAARAGPLAIAGIDDLFTVHQDIAKTLRSVRAVGGVPVAIAHSDTRHYLHGDIRLQLVGHTHCGQVELGRFGLSNPYTHTNYPCGIARDADGVTVTTAGLGTSIWPLRFFAPPDLWVITLGPAAARRG